MNRRLVCCLFLLGNMLLVSISDSAEEAPKTKKPNIVLIISDDLADRQPKLIRQIGLWMDESHTPSDVWPSPGESSQEFKVRLQRAGVSPRVVNIDG
jgi:hypothetical protein